ncbi:MAG: sialidase family protein [Spirochaetota bacterium]
MTFNEVHFHDPRTKTYLGSPSIVRAPDGALIAAHDYFGPGCPRNHENEEHLTSIYRSEDDGATWEQITHIANAYWSTLFTHRGALYLFGVSQQYGSIVIRRSDDSGFTWTHPADERSGLLFHGGYYHENPNYHTAPVPVLVHNGRIWRAFEDCVDCVWGGGFASFVISADENADLLNASSWTMSNKLTFDSKLIPNGVTPVREWGWLEGNIVAAPDGSLKNILRLHSWMSGKAAMLDVSADGKNISFDAAKSFIDMPGHHSKFTIRRDPKSGNYLSFVNATKDDPNYWRRNVLSLAVSSDCIHWKVIRELIRDDSKLSAEDSGKFIGFQYVDWQFDGDDIIYLVRTGYDGAHTFHDANRITFHRLKKYVSNGKSA